MSEEAYNPLSRANLAASVGEALLDRAPIPLRDLAAFPGAGIYAIYYTGNFAPYSAISAANADGAFTWPIYVGKAVPSGARKGGTGQGAGSVLFGRLREHRDTIVAAENLQVDDFHCRYLVVEDIWIPLAESLLIAKFSPIWNRLVDGFGNHDPGGGRYQGMRPRWHVLHPGAGWAMKCRERPESGDQIATEIETYLRTAPRPPARPRLHDV